MLELPPSKTVFGHADVDAFYASASQVQNRFLRGKPVGVISNQGYFVVAKSIELKRCGVKTGEPLKEAIEKCPDAIFVKRNFDLYNVLSDRFHALMRYLSHTTETYSVDECFFQLPDREAPEKFALTVRDTIKKHVGLPITVGLGRSKTLAKLISDTAKPFGAKVVLGPEAERIFLVKMPIMAVAGIAGRRAQRLQRFGIRTCLDYINTDPRTIREVLTVEGLKLWHELRGDPVLPLLTSRKRYQILTRGGSVGQPTLNKERGWGFVARNLERLIEELQFHKLKTAKVELAMQFYRNDFSYVYRVASERLESCTDRFDVLVASFQRFFAQCWMSGLRIARMHLLAHNLQPAATAQRGLFDPPEEPYRSIAQAKREINSQIRRFVVRSGATLPLKDVYDDPALNVESVGRERTVY